MDSGYSERVSSSTEAMYALTPVESDRISAMPIMPIEPANAVSSVRAFFVRRFWKERTSAVPNDMEEWRLHRFCAGSSRFSGGVKGSESARITPSDKRTMRVA